MLYPLYIFLYKSIKTLTYTSNQSWTHKFFIRWYPTVTSSEPSVIQSVRALLTGTFNRHRLFTWVTIKHLLCISTNACFWWSKYTTSITLIAQLYYSSMWTSACAEIQTGDPWDMLRNSNSRALTLPLSYIAIENFIISLLL